MTSKPFLFAGGTLPRDAFYVQRDADDDLFQYLSQGRFCYVLGPNQIGKSSLRHRTQERLKAAGIWCAGVDLSGIVSKTATASGFYASLIKNIGQKLELSGVDEFLAEQSEAASMQSLVKFLEELVLRQLGGSVVLFFDEIQTVKLLSFPVDEFFATLRSLYNLRPDNPSLERLTCCFLGVVSPTDLSSDPNQAPFNIAQPIRLEDFSAEQVYRFDPLIARKLAGPTRPWVDEVFAWTQGHPYMTQHVLDELRKEPPPPHADIKEVVSALVRRLFLESESSINPVFVYATNWFKGRREEEPSGGPSGGSKANQLDLYHRLLLGEEVAARLDDPNQLQLVITGMAAWRTDAHRRVLKVRNPIFAQFFDQKWIDRQQTDRQIALAVSHWVTSGRLPQHLYRGTSLRAARKWADARADLAPEESQFIIASLEQEAKDSAAEAEHRAFVSKRRTRFLLWTSGVLVFSIIGSIQSCLHARQEAERRELDFEQTRCLYNDYLACNALAETLERRCQSDKNKEDCKRIADKYLGGDGVPKNELRARQFYERGCEKGDGASCSQVGVFRERSVNYAGAYEMYERACKLGFGLGCSNQGYLLEKGWGVPADRAQAFQLYDLACKRGFADGCNNLGWLNLQDEQGPESLEHAEQNLQTACNANYALGCLNLGWLHEKASVKNPAQHPIDKAAEAYAKACSLNDGRGCTSLGLIYSRFRNDKAYALQYYKEGCNHEDARGCNNAGALLEKGEGTTQDLARAAFYYMRACEAPVPYINSCGYLAAMFGKGVGVAQNAEREKFYMERFKSLQESRPLNR